ncbi:uncharacterized protein KGF55_004540 [Candida pseudojiufengensis]|uniref:uncharacterized protein n=1 Tax=Candida pseudojiufengensis TaxID=497109 RepID=UPI002225914E|nr:uncharacterized protein KGF55_004540 [Candida pseudojiufengensis]KAI5960647.1 hypothetical protein KGF55_004540 [Candida pseudojiufengensis]
MSDDSSIILNSSSVNESTINLNDDLPIGSEHSSIIIEQSPSFNNNNFGNHLRTHKRTGSTNSFTKSRLSLDNESYISSGTLYNFDENINRTEYSPLGPNSIYELTIGSDNARARRNRIPKASVTLNGGTTTIYNLNIPTNKEIPRIQLEKLKKNVSNHELEAKFVNDIAKEYKKFEESQKKLTEDSLRKLSQPNERGELSTSSSIENFQNIEQPLLNEVPSVFLDPNFKLDDPRIFKKVLENSNLKLEQDQIINDTDLQEKFSNYLDIVEMNLIGEIEKSSDSFFDTIGDIENIQKKSENCVHNYQNIVQKLDQIEQNQAKQGLKILEKMIERKNVESLEITVIQLQYITSIFQLANISFHNNDFFKCLNQIVAVESLINGIPRDEIVDEEIKKIYPKLEVINLTNLPALIHLINDLQTLKTDCSRKYINDFIDLLLKDLSNHYKTVPTKDTLNRLYVNKDKSKKYSTKPINTSFKNLDPDFQSKLKDYVSNLIKGGNLINAYTLYQNRFIGEIKEIIKSDLPTSQKIEDIESETSPTPPDSSTTSQSNVLSTNLKVLTPKEFETMISKTYAQLSECLRRLTVHQKLLLDIALTTISQTSNINIMSLDISRAIHKAIELTQIRLMKIINIRSEQTADLPIHLYLRLYSITTAYLQECELINPTFESIGAGNALKEWFQQHITYFLHRLHTNASKSMSLSCSKETWRVVDDPEVLGPAQISLTEQIQYAEYIQSNGSKGISGDEWLSSFDFYEDEEMENTEKQQEYTINMLKIDENEFISPKLAVIVINHIKNYLIATKAFPSFTNTIENNILNYFKELNSKTSQSVLSAGATRTAGLKHITTKHLAICIRFIEFNIAFIQHLQLIFKDVRTEDQLSFAKMISNYKDHETELFAKIITIMQERTIAACNKLPDINWSEPVKHPLQCHQYMENLVRDTITVAKVLMKHLPELKYSLVLSQIFDSYKRLFIESYCTKLPSFKDFNEKHNLLKDIDYFRVKLSELPGYGNSGVVIWENVNSMPTLEDIEMDEKMRKNVDVEKAEASTSQSAEPSVKSQNTFQKLVSSARSSFEKSSTPKPEDVDNVKANNEQEKSEAPGSEILFDSTNPESEKVVEIVPDISTGNESAGSGNQTVTTNGNNGTENEGKISNGETKTLENENGHDSNSINEPEKLVITNEDKIEDGLDNNNKENGEEKIEAVSDHYNKVNGQSNGNFENNEDKGDTEESKNDDLEHTNVEKSDFSNGNKNGAEYSEHIPATIQENTNIDEEKSIADDEKSNKLENEPKAIPNEDKIENENPLSREVEVLDEEAHNTSTKDEVPGHIEEEQPKSENNVADELVSQFNDLNVRESTEIKAEAATSSNINSEDTPSIANSENNGKTENLQEDQKPESYQPNDENSNNAENEPEAVPNEDVMNSEGTTLREIQVADKEVHDIDTKIIDPNHTEKDPSNSNINVADGLASSSNDLDVEESTELKAEPITVSNFNSEDTDSITNSENNGKTENSHDDQKSESSQSNKSDQHQATNKSKNQKKKNKKKNKKR